MAPCVGVARALASSIGVQLRAGLGKSAVGYQTASARNLCDKLEFTSIVPPALPIGTADIRATCPVPCPPTRESTTQRCSRGMSEILASQTYSHSEGEVTCEAVKFIQSSFLVSVLNVPI
jgi:hypothetical protein